MNIEELFAMVKKRQLANPAGSYIVSLLNNRDRLIQKIGEEATEVVVAAKNPDRSRQIEEITDLFFHMTVLLSALSLQPRDIYDELEKRKKQPGA